MKAIIVNNLLKPEFMEYGEVSEPIPNFNEEIINVTSIGVNFGDIERLDGYNFSSHGFPHIPGVEVAGYLENGERVVAFLKSGGYAQKVCARKDHIFKIPKDFSDETALTIFAQGITAWIAINKIGNLKSGKTVLIHAAAGGVGSIAVQIAKSLGAFVIAAVSTQEKAELVKTLGADLVVDPHDSNLRGMLQETNSGIGPDLVLEMVGGKRFDTSLEVLAPLGKLVTYGMVSRKLPSQIQPTELINGSKTISGLYLDDYFQLNGFIQSIYDELCEFVITQKIKPIFNKYLALSLASRAHQELLGRKNIGKILLDPTT